MKRFAFGALAAFLIAACGSAAPSTSGTGKPEKTTVEMAVGGVSQFIYMPLTLAQQLGYYKDEGLTVHGFPGRLPGRECARRRTG
jgi:NitT/TauT family transport system substrate-binding protein